MATLHDIAAGWLDLWNGDMTALDAIVADGSSPCRAGRAGDGGADDRARRARRLDRADASGDTHSALLGRGRSADRRRSGRATLAC